MMKPELNRLILYLASRDNRSEDRKKACIQAFASYITDTFDIKCIIRDVSESGCMIVSSQIHELPSLIQLVPEGFDNPINSLIVWRKDKKAGVLFLSPNDDAAVDRINRYYFSAAIESDDDEPLQLDCLARPLGYAERLAKFTQRAK